MKKKQTKKKNEFHEEEKYGVSFTSKDAQNFQYTTKDTCFSKEERYTRLTREKRCTHLTRKEKIQI